MTKSYYDIRGSLAHRAFVATGCNKTWLKGAQPTFAGFVGALIVALFAFLITAPDAFAQDPLPSWRDNAAKQRIVSFVQDVTDSSSPNYVPEQERIAVFDNDGTLWSEKPVYFQLQFAIDRVKALSDKHPEWKATQPFKAILENDQKALLGAGTKGLLEVIAKTHAGMTEKEFRKTVEDWIASAKHPRFERAYTELTYTPMQEVLTYLRANGFKIFIVSGGGLSFMRPWAPKIYGVPVEQIIGSVIKTKFEMRSGGPALVRLEEMFFVDDKDQKPVGIHTFIGRRPIAAFGNSDGDLQMLQWTSAGDGASLKVLIQHTDAEREWAYDRDSKIGRLDKALDEARQHGWTVVDMKNDWNRVFSFEE